jgi:hypothetical protein
MHGGIQVARWKRLTKLHYGILVIVTIATFDVIGAE